MDVDGSRSVANWRQAMPEFLAHSARYTTV